MTPEAAAAGCGSVAADLSAGHSQQAALHVDAAAGAPLIPADLRVLAQRDVIYRVKAAADPGRRVVRNLRIPFDHDGSPEIGAAPQVPRGFVGPKHKVPAQGRRPGSESAAVKAGGVFADLAAREDHAAVAGRAADIDAAAVALASAHG